MFKARKLHDTYDFVWLAWGNTDIRQARQDELVKKFPCAIKVHKLNY